MNAGKRFLQTLWRISLWFTGPIVIVIFYWLFASFQHFYSSERALLAEYSRPFNDYLQYQKQYLQNQVLAKFHHPKLESKAHNTISLLVDESDLRLLNSQLPQSGKNYVKGILQINGAEYDIKVRYRGNHPAHWRGHKKSLRIKSTKGLLFDNLKDVELLAPQSSAIIKQHLIYSLAEDMGLIAPQSQIVWLVINGQPFGVYHLVELLGEQTLLNRRFMPGDIYAGDRAERDAVVGIDNRLFQNAGLWRKLAESSDYSKHHDIPLVQLIESLQIQPLSYSKLQMMVDYPSFARFYWLLTLAKVNNLDAWHNWRLYYDYSVARFFPIVWDPEGWSVDSKETEGLAISKTKFGDSLGSQNYSTGKLFDILLSDPQFQQELLRQQTLFPADGLLLAIDKQVQALSQQLTPFIKADPLSVVDLDFYGYEDFSAAIKQTEQFIANQRQQLENSAKVIDVQEAIDQKTLVWQGQVKLSGIRHIFTPLTVKAGTEVILEPDALLVVHNRLMVEGEADNNVRFIASDPDRPYAAIVLQGAAANGSILNHCQFSGGSRFYHPLVNHTAMFTVSQVSNLTIEHCNFSNNVASDDMVHFVYSQVTVSNSSFQQSSGDGLDVELSDVYIKNSQFTDNRHEGIDSMNSNILIQASVISGNADNAVSAGQRTSMWIESSTIKQNKTALLVKDDSLLRLIDSKVIANKQIAKLFHRNEHYRNQSSLYASSNEIKYFASGLELEPNHFVYLKDNNFDSKLEQNDGVIDIERLKTPREQVLGRTIQMQWKRLFSKFPFTMSVSSSEG